jgi:uncharacterized protein YkwD
LFEREGDIVRRATRAISSDSAAEKARLVSIGSSNHGEYQLSKQIVTIGSHRSNDLVIDDSTVSRRHATITHKTGGFELLDLGSTNGTLVNGKRLRVPVALGRGDEIKFGSARYSFIATGDPGSTQSIQPHAQFRLRQFLTLLAVMFIAGFAGVRYRSDIGPGVSVIVAWISARQSNSTPSAPSAANTQSVSANLRATEASQAASPPPSASKSASLRTNPKLPSSPAAAAVSQPKWIERLNYFRSLASLSPVTDDDALDDADYKHARYLVKNHSLSNGDAHSEDPKNPWYTPEGFAAAQSSDLIPPCHGCDRLSQQETIDEWVSVPFHRLIILNPDLRRAGYGEYHEEEDAYVLSLPAYPPKGRLNDPILFPPDHGNISLATFSHEWPSPWASCPGYAEPRGLPITMLFGGGAATVSSHSLKLGNKELEHCVFDSNTYSNPDPVQAEWGKNILKLLGGVVLIPRSPLAKGAKYAVSITANDKKYDWTFATRP